jgi:ATP-dependent Clp protease adaptor protein ClpS
MGANKIQIEEQEITSTRTSLVPRYHVILLDDNDHTYEYVIEMLVQIFGHSSSKAYEMACTVDQTGRVIVETTHKERAEMKRDQIHNYGADWRLAHSKGSMSAVIEPE